MYKLFVLGIAEPVLSAAQEKILTQCSLLVGTTRFRPLTAHLPGQFLSITPLPAALDIIRAELHKGNVAVLASGDPLFYGIGRRLLAAFDEKIVQFYPGLSSIQRACALFKIPWDDARITSLHGRDSAHLPGLLLHHSKNLILTDTNNRPELIAGRLLTYLRLIGEPDLENSISMLVAEDLGLPGEKLFRGSLDQAVQHVFSPLNIVCLLVPGINGDPCYSFGLSEDLIQHSRGLITKNEVRAATLHQLQLPRQGIFWDIGAGSGSLSIEAARLHPELTIFAVEHKQQELTNIKNNIVKFGCYNIVPVFGRAPEMLTQLPDPDRIFIGGSSGSLPAIIELADRRLPQDGRLVINGVIEKTVRQAPELMRRHHFTVNSSQISVSRTEKDGRIVDYNPITIMTGTR